MEKKRNMEDKQWYVLSPSSMICGKVFKKVQCDCQVPGKPNEYIVSGIPEGGTKTESFVLQFTEMGGVRVIPASPPPHLRIVK